MIELLKNYLKKMMPNSPLVASLGHANCRIINGSFKVDQCIVDEKLRINGVATFGRNTIVKKSIIVNGQLEITGATLEDDLFANGTTDINSSTLKQKGHFGGNLTARDCQFLDSINLLAHSAAFINCQINHIIVNALPYVKTPQKIHLSNGCEVNGDITFEAGNGEVWIEKSSQIRGKVNGGRIIII